MHSRAVLGCLSSEALAFMVYMTPLNNGVVTLQTISGTVHLSLRPAWLIHCFLHRKLVQERTSLPCTLTVLRMRLGFWLERLGSSD